MRFNVASTNDDVIHQRRGGYVRRRVLPTINGGGVNHLANSAGSASTGKSSTSGNGDNGGYAATRGAMDPPTLVPDPDSDLGPSWHVDP